MIEKSKRALVMIGAISLTISCGSSNEPQAESTRLMAERLEEIAATASPQNHVYLNDRRVEYFRKRIEYLNKSGAAKDPRVKMKILDTRFRMASELLRAGRSEKAAQVYRELQSEADPGFQKVLRMLEGISYLRLGEQENCIIQHSIDSCLLPIRDSGIHQLERGSRAAIDEFLSVLSENPDNLTPRWLLNIAYMTLGEYPEGVPAAHLIPPETFASDYDIKHFEDVAVALGLDVIGNAGGAVMEDFDGDGHLDIMASSWSQRHQIRYFHNSGDGTFTDMTKKSGLTGIVGGLNAHHADYDNNGYPDVIFLRGAWLDDHGKHPNSLLANLGENRFIDATEEAGLLTLHPTQTAAWGDYDNDGWVDLFVGNETENDEQRPCELFRNLGASTNPVRFRDEAEAAGVAAVGFVKGVIWGDYNNDGRLDLYISRYGENERNMLFQNRGDESGRWHFVDVAVEAGVTGPDYSFPTWFWDYDNDGWEDLFMAGYNGNVDDVIAGYLGLPHAAETPKLYRNMGDGTFEDVTQKVGIEEPLLAMGCNYGDLDNDGYLDFYIGTGDPNMVTIVPNRMFRNANGLHFQDVTTSGAFGHLQKGHGVAFGDLDHDGDQEVFSVMGGNYSGDVYQNVLFRNPGHGNHWLKVKLEGRRSNRAAIGARIEVTVSGPEGVRSIFSTVSSGGSFGSSSFRQEIGLGQATSIQSLKVFWPATDERQVFRDVPMDRTLYIQEGNPQIEVHEFASFELASGKGSSQHDHH